MATKLFPSLQNILYHLASAATADASNAPRSDNPGRFPVVVRPETRAFLEAQAGRLGGSIAGVAGAILDGVAMSSTKRDDGPTSLRGIVERFNLLIEEHRLSYPGAAEALRDLGFSLADFSTPEATVAKLTAPTLRAVADRFHVQYDWLSGTDDCAAKPLSDAWYKAADGAARRLMHAVRTSTEAELSIVIWDDADLSKHAEDDRRSAPHFLPVVKRSKVLNGGEILETYELWEEGQWTYWRCREHIKLAIHFATRLRAEHHRMRLSGRTMSKAMYKDLVEGRVLPATAMRSAGQITWYPDDFVIHDSKVAKDPGAWLSIRSNEEYASTFEQFEEILQGKDRLAIPV